MKKLIIAVIVVLVVVGGAFYWSQKSAPEIVNNSPTPANDYKNISYNIDGQTIQLKNGTFESQAASGSAEVITTEYFGNEARGDFNGDGTEDVAFLMVQSGGGTGAFFYVVAALKTADGYKGTNGIYLGDRIAPQTTEFRNGQIIVNYADRKPNEPFSATPSVGVSKYLKIVGDQLVEISQTPTPTSISTAKPSASSTPKKTVSPTPANVTIQISNFSFNPQTVTLKKGTKVTWVNNDSVSHTVTSDSGSLLNSPTIAPGQSFSFTFTGVGTATYHCSIHPSMKGTVTVTN